jgi:hypothetical protein
LIAALLLTQAGVTAAAEGQGLPPDLALVPPDAIGFLAVRVADVAGGLEKLAKDDPTLAAMLKAMDEKGMAPAKIERAVAVFQHDPVFVVTFLRPFDKDRVQKKLVPDAQEKKAGGKSYLANSDRNAALHLANDRTLVFGSPRALEGYLEGGAKPKARPNLAAALATAAGKHFAVLAHNPDKAATDVAPRMKPFLPLLQARSVAVVDLEAKAWACTMRFAYDSEDAARAGEKAAQQVLDLMKAQLPQAIAQMTKVPEGSPQKAATESLRQSLQEVETALKDARLTCNGKVVEGTLRVPTENPTRSGAMMVQVAVSYFILMQPTPEKPRISIPKPDKPERPSR